jgi:hypothetical protein
LISQSNPEQKSNTVGVTKWIEDLNVGPEAVKLQERVGKTLEHIGMGNNFLIELQ